jgi:hypothetical protein
MTLARDFNVSTGQALSTITNWRAPLFFNDVDDELILTRTITHFPVELFNDQFPDKATDSRPIEIYRGRTIPGIDTATISVSGETLTDTSATFPTSPNLTGRLLRDAASQVFRIVSNTATTLTVEPITGINLTTGKYIVLPDFVNTTTVQRNFELDLRTIAAPGEISNLVSIEGGALVLQNFEQDELANLIFLDGNGDRFIIRSNNQNTILFFETTTPVLGNGMAILPSHVDSAPLPFVDTFLNEDEAADRNGTGLRPNKYYYYTMFTKPVGANVAQAEFGATDAGTPTQDVVISADRKEFGTKLYNFWPSVYRELDQTEDLQDLMQVFGFFFDELHALIDTYNLQDPDNVLVTGVLPLSEQFGLPQVGFSIGADTLRRIAKDIISAFRLKGSKEGIAKFIRIITTWDITNGTGDFSGAILDSIPNVAAFRLFDLNLGNANTRFSVSDPLFIQGGRFARGLPGIVIPGFFTFREFVITVPNVALYVGSSISFSVQENSTTMTDTSANFGALNSLVGNFLLPNQEEVNDLFEIIANTSTSITVRGIINNRNPGGFYAVFSPLNTNRFIILNRLLPFYVPFGTAGGFQFV